MFGKMCRVLRKKDGFTLVELMVVVVIIGILAGIAVPVYQNVQTEAADNAHDANLRIIKSAIEMYKLDNAGSEPTETGDLVPDYIQEWPTAPDGHDSADYLNPDDILTSDMTVS